LEIDYESKIFVFEFNFGFRFIGRMTGVKFDINRGTDVHASIGEEAIVAFGDIRALSTLNRQFTSILDGFISG
jgi:hypothetical protein